VISPTDPAARYTASANSVAGYAYSDNYLIDLKHAVIVDVEATTTGLSRKLGSGRTRGEGLGSCSGRSRRPPILKRFASKSAERIAGNEMALDVERVLDCGMNGQEPLC
jgi:hypothetical protein